VEAAVPRASAPLLVALDSRRADPYVQIFDHAGDPVSKPAAVLPEHLPGYVRAAIGVAGLRIAGDAAEAAAAALAEWELEALVETAPDAGGVLTAALHQIAKAVETPARPLYLRPPDVSFPKARP
jgi:tRNA threonylcarbamoyladenosine biosynthesis protein TsaB